MPGNTIQNVENKDAILNMLNTAQNTKTTSDKADFSNLFNNISAKTQQMQTQFIDKAVKSNTSSINRFVVADNKTPSKNIKDTQANINITKKDINKKTAVKKEQISSTKYEKDNSKNLSDKTKSPSQKSSPDFSSDKEDDKNIVEKQKDDENLNDVVQNLLLTFDIDLSQDDELNNKMEETLQDVENVDEVIDSIDNISDFVDNSDFLNEDKDKILSAFDKIKQMVKSIQEELPEDDKSIQDPKKILDNAILKMTSNEEIKPDLDEELKSTANQQIELSTNTDKLTQQVINSTSEALEELKDIIKNNDNQKISQISSDLAKTLQELYSNEQNKDIDFNKKLNKTLDELNKILSDKDDADFELLQDDIAPQDNTEIELKTTYDAKSSDAEVFEDKLKKFTDIKERIQKLYYEQIQSQKGALTVADEVVKLALDENNTNLNSLQGSVIYDSASGNGSLIKNASLLLRGVQTQQNIQNTNSEIEKSDILNQIGSKLQDLKNGAQKLTVVLRPMDLGRLSIELTNNKNGLTTNIIAQNDDVRQYLEKNINNLRQQLTDSGINVNSIEIKTHGEQNSSFYEGNQNPFKDDTEQNQQNHQHQQNHQNQKQQKDELFTMSNYDMQYNKDFSSILNKSLNYSLN